jgi:hypothetical protein
MWWGIGRSRDVVGDAIVKFALVSPVKATHVKYLVGLYFVLLRESAHGNDRWCQVGATTKLMLAGCGKKKTCGYDGKTFEPRVAMSFESGRAGAQPSQGRTVFHPMTLKIYLP